MAETEQTKSSTVSFWIGQIDTYERQFSPWKKRSKEIIKRYRDERKDAARTRARFNVLWSNVQTLAPAIYNAPPKANIDRRYQDDDDLGRYAALVLERSVSYYVNNDMFDKVMKQIVLDRLLPGRGVAWVRYVPVINEPEQVTDDTTSEEATIESEDTVIDYVHWEDFGHTWARTWQEVRGVWRRVFMSRAELVNRFGTEKGNQISLDAKPETDGDNESNSKAAIYEIWDKAKKKAIWIHRDMQDVLDELDDPLQLKDFFPCPEPLYATLTNEDLIPSPDYTLYQDQALELDMLTGRISSISKSLKVAGVYDASAEGLDRLLSEGVENKLIPVQQWAVLGGGTGAGLKNAISFFPLQEIIQTLVSIYDARDRVKNDLYEITGISDVIRGATKATETATAQQLKGQYASLRLDNQQKDVARVCRDVVRIMTEIIANHFSLDTIKKVSGIRLLTEVEKKQIQDNQALSQQSGQEFPIPDKIKELLDMPTWEQVDQLIRDETARSFRIDIETDSTIKTDQEAEKQARTEFLTATGGFMAQAVQMPLEMQPLLMKMLLFGVRGFKVSREIETEFENAISEAKKAAENPPPPQPSPEQIKAEAENQKLQLDNQAQQQEIASRERIEGAKIQNDDADRAFKLEEMNHKREIMKHEKDKMAFEGDRMLLEFHQSQNQPQQPQGEEMNFSRETLQRMIADKDQQEADEMNQQAVIQQQQQAQAEMMAAKEQQQAEFQNALLQGIVGIQEMLAQNTMATQTLAAAVSAPKTIVRGADGMVQGVVNTTGTMQ